MLLNNLDIKFIANVENSYLFILSHMSNPNQNSSSSQQFDLTQILANGWPTYVIAPLANWMSPFPNYTFSNNFLNLGNFNLEENSGNQNKKNDEEEEEHVECGQHIREVEDEQILDEKQLLIQGRNMLQFLVRWMHKEEKRIRRARENLEKGGYGFEKKLFDCLYRRLEKVKKTKEEKIKYCIRKSFKYIQTKLRNENKQMYRAMEDNEVINAYFQKHNDGREPILVPFQKNSLEKTMNDHFLKKLFKCRQFNIDYHHFLTQFSAQLQTDNKKKISTLNKIIEEVAQKKSLKSLQEIKRLPWTQQILDEMENFAKKDLLDHAPLKSLTEVEAVKQTPETVINDSFTGKITPRKASVCFITPPMDSLADPAIEKE